MTLSEKWKATVDSGVADAAWDSYDALITLEIADYNKRLAATSGESEFARAAGRTMDAMAALAPAQGPLAAHYVLAMRAVTAR